MNYTNPSITYADMIMDRINGFYNSDDSWELLENDIRNMMEEIYNKTVESDEFEQMKKESWDEGYSIGYKEGVSDTEAIQ